jgi:hypothetical protein
MATILGRNFIEQIKTVTTAFYDINIGAMRESMDTSNLNLYIPKEGIETLRRFTQLIACTKFIKDDNARYFLCSSKRYNDVAKDLNISPTALRKKIFHYCSVSTKNPGKVVKLLGSNFLTDIIDYRRKDLDDINVKINTALVKELGLKDLSLNISIDIPKYNGDANISDNEFNSLLNLIYPYTKAYKNSTLEELTKEQCKYFWYLINNQKILKGEDAERFIRLEKLVEGRLGEDIIE